MENVGKPIERTINMNISDETWKKVGILSALQGSTKRNIVETAIEQYYRKQRGDVAEV